MNKILFLSLLFLLASCTRQEPVEVGEVPGLKPVYISEEENMVSVLEAREFGDLGKIVYSEPYLFINERFKGIHVLNNANPADPIKIAFIQIPGNTDFTLKGANLYANHGNDLKTFEIAPDALATGIELLNLIEVSTISNFFADSGQAPLATLAPLNYQGFFECVETDKGIVIGWADAILVNPECKI